MHDSARSTFVIGSALIESDGQQWIEVIPAVEKARNGRWFFTVDANDLKTYASSIESQPGLIPVDYDHSESGSTAAAGWFTGETLIVATGGMNPAGDTQTHESLWARVKWTPQAVEEIRDGRFKRLSPEFRFAKRDPKTGLLTKATEIIASTLTNKPYFRQLAPIAADQISEPDVDALAEEIGITPDQVIRVVTRVAETQSGSAAEHEGDEMPVDYKAFATALGLAEDADEDTIKAAFADASAKASKVDELTAEVEKLKQNDDKTELEQLREELKVETTKRIENERETELTTAISEGRMLPAEKDVLIEAFGDNIEALKKVLAARPKNTVLARERGGSEGGEQVDLPEDADTFKGKGDRADDPIDEDSMSLHAKALQILGKDDYSETEYMSALKKAGRELAVTA